MRNLFTAARSHLTAQNAVDRNATVRAAIVSLGAAQIVRSASRSMLASRRTIAAVADALASDDVVTGSELDALCDMSVAAMAAPRSLSTETHAGEKQSREYQKPRAPRSPCKALRYAQRAQVSR